MLVINFILLVRSVRDKCTFGNIFFVVSTFADLTNQMRRKHTRRERDMLKNAVLLSDSVITVYFLCGIIHKCQIKYTGEKR